MGRIIEHSRRQDRETLVMWATRADNPDSEAERIAYQEKRYAASGFTNTSLMDKLEEARHGLDSGEGAMDFMLYRGTSDPTRWIERAHDLKGMKILSVAGSGEIAERFTNQDISQIHIIDQSPAAAFMNELRLAAAPHLTWVEFLKLINPETTGRGSMREQPLFDVTEYKKIRQYLSSQAQNYFDTIMLPGYEEFFKSRAVRIGRTPIIDRRHSEQSIAPHLKSEDAFKAYQAKLAKLVWSIQIGDMGEEPHSAGRFDFAYISNIGFGATETAALAVEMVKRGAKKVGLTFTELDALNAGKVASPTQYVRTGPTLHNMPIVIGDRVTAKVDRANVPIHIVDIDKSVGCSYYGVVNADEI